MFNLFPRIINPLSVHTPYETHNKRYLLNNLMPFVSVNGAEIYYELHGSGEETVVFSHGFLLSSKMFQKQVEQLKEKYSVLVYDHRGQGQSEITEDGYSIDNYTQDAKELLDELVEGPVHFAGLSTGGFVGLRLALHYPDKIKSLILLNTTAQVGSRMKRIRFKFLRIIVRLFGFKLVVNPVMKALFGKTYLNNEQKKDEREEWKEFLINNEKMGMYRAFEAAVEREDITEQLSKITVPCLVIGGEEDKGLSPEEAEHLHNYLPNSELNILENVGHSSTIEVPQQTTDLIKQFLEDNL